MSFKIAFIGAGSVGFTRRLLSDLLTVPEFHDIEVAFTDINPKNLDMVYRLCQRDIDENGLSIKIRPTLDRREAFRDAKYVINAVRIGMLEAFEKDIEVALRYGVDQCVGDTLAAGGIMYGQRGIPQILDFCRDIREVASPGCILLSYSNPCAMMTWAANKYGHVQTVGLCHGVQGGHWQIANALGYRQDEVDITAAGLNHQTWYIRVSHNGEDLTDKILPAYEANEWLSKTEKVRIDMLKRFGYYSTESNGHLSEYVPKESRRDQQMARSRGRLVERRDGRVSARLPREPELVRNRFSELARRAREPVRPRKPFAGARFVYHRGARDRTGVPRAFQRHERGHDLESAL